jgi:hypothetical protein
LNIARRKANIAENAERFSCVIPKARRVVPRRDERISPFFRRKTALDVRTEPIYWGLAPKITAMQYLRQ